MSIVNFVNKIDSIIFPSRTKKHWKLFNKYLATNNRFKRVILLRKIVRIQEGFNCSIPVSNRISPFTAPHGLSGIFISAGATVAPDCIIFQNVTIGSNTIKGHPREGSPTIGKGVMIGANAVVIGKVDIGDNARIGAGCAVACDVPANATAVSEKPRIFGSDEDRKNVFRTFAESMAEKTESNKA